MKRVIQLRKKSIGLLTSRYADEYEATFEDESRTSRSIANWVALLSVLVVSVQTYLVCKQAEISQDQVNIAAKTQRLVSDPEDYSYLANLRISRTRYPATKTNQVIVENLNQRATTEAALVIQGIANVTGADGRVDRSLMLAYIPLDVVEPCQRIQIPISTYFFKGWRLFQPEFDGNEYRYSAYRYSSIERLEVGTMHLALRGGYRWWTLTEPSPDSDQSIRRYSEVGPTETEADSEALAFLEEIPEDYLIGDTIAESVENEFRAIGDTIHSANPVFFNSPEQPSLEHDEVTLEEMASSSKIKGCGKDLTIPIYSGE